MCVGVGVFMYVCVCVYICIVCARMRFVRRSVRRVLCV